MFSRITPYGTRFSTKKAGKEGVKLADRRAKERRIAIGDNQEAQTQNNIIFEKVADMRLAKKGVDRKARHAKRQKERLADNVYSLFGSGPLHFKQHYHWTSTAHLSL